ncbi:MAG TPA: glycosyltransferase, partial [Actinobacteria bacterium]|nr:glycosyltransferase [Actinomycetota bacterium]
MKTPDLSIIIVNWNTKYFLEKCFRSVYENSDGLNFEIFVIDNASTDGSQQMVKEKFPDVNLIE